MLNFNKLKVLIVRLSSEETVSLSFSHKFLFELLNEKFNDNIILDYFFFPKKYEFIKLSNNNYKHVLSKNLQIPISEFDVIAISNSTLLELINLSHLLLMLNVPLKLIDRFKNNNIPLIILGGINTPSITCITGGNVSNNNLLDDGLASLVDLIFLGEAECNLPQFISLLLNNPDFKNNKFKIINLALKSILGLYFPPNFIHEFILNNHNELVLKKIYNKDSDKLVPVKHAILNDITNAFEFSSYIYEDFISDATIPVEISRGCAFTCSFCKEGYTQKPYREKSLNQIIKTCQNLYKKLGISRFNLYSYNFSEHSEIHDIVQELSNNYFEAEVKSQRIDTAIYCPNLISFLQKLGSHSPTFAIEGISYRIRCYLSKNIDNEILTRFMNIIFKTMPRQVKLFFIVTGLEEENDFNEFKNFIKNLLAYRDKFSPNTSIIFSFMPLIMCQKTPLMFAKVPDFTNMFNIIDKLLKVLQNKKKVIARCSLSKNDYVVSQIMEYGGREITNALVKLALNEKFAYYDYIDNNIFQRFIQYINECQFSFTMLHSEKNINTVFNSDDREYSFDKNFLYNAWLCAKNFKNLICQKCQVCLKCKIISKNDNKINNDKNFKPNLNLIDNKLNIKKIISVAIENNDLPYKVIADKIKKPFKIINDVISRLPNNYEKFYGKNYYLIEIKNYNEDINLVFNDKIKEIKKTSLDFMYECNYLYLEVNKMNLNSLNININDKQMSLKEIAAKIFNKFNLKFKPLFKILKFNPITSMSGDYLLVTNENFLKKMLDIPFILYDLNFNKLQMLIKKDEEVLRFIMLAKIIEYFKIDKYDLKSETFCNNCQRLKIIPSEFLCENFNKNYECIMCKMLS